MILLLGALLFAALACALPPPIGSGPSLDTTIQPRADIAAERGPAIFNSIFDSLRIYGSSLHPNGMSLTVATIPKGVLLYHGNGHNATPTTFDWLAFEIYHAEFFAMPDRRPRHPRKHGLFESVEDQFSLVGRAEDGADKHGWLHTYQTTRPLRFLYLNGMSGNKDGTGVSDTQDFILRASDVASAAAASMPPQEVPKPPGPANEFERVRDICQLCAEWQLEGVIRTENPGHEVIKCDFSQGLEEVQSVQRKDKGIEPLGGGPGRDRGERPGLKLPYNFENGFRDVGANRVQLDYSSMVSVLSFPVNVTNPDTHPVEKDLPRLVEVTSDERLAIKNYLARKLDEARGPPSQQSLSWRDVADLIVRRYAERLSAIAKPSEDAMLASSVLAGIQSLLNVFVDYSIDDVRAREADARRSCSLFSLQSKPVRTESDKWIHAAFKATNEIICDTLFDAQTLLQTQSTSEAVQSAQISVQQLIHTLDWSVFEKSDNEGESR